jgi:hypothetical protein
VACPFIQPHDVGDAIVVEVAHPDGYDGLSVR